MTRDQLVTALGDSRLAELLLPDAWHSMMIAPLYARGLILGDLQVWRIKDPEPFSREDVELVTEIASRGALAIDNARRCTREHPAAVALPAASAAAGDHRHPGSGDPGNPPARERRSRDRWRLLDRPTPPGRLRGRHGSGGAAALVLPWLLALAPLGRTEPIR
ncbi:GAF domain-containing protein [Streptomyces sp. NPDC003015]